MRQEDLKVNNTEIFVQGHFNTTVFHFDYSVHELIIESNT